LANFRYESAESDYKQAKANDPSLNVDGDIRELSKLAKQARKKDFYKILG